MADQQQYTIEDNGALHAVAKPQPTRQAIEDDLKPYIKEVVKEELAKNGR